MARDTCETHVFAHLYRKGSEPLNVMIRVRRVPCVGEFIAITGEPSWWSELGLKNDPGPPHHFEVLSVTHIDLDMAKDIEAEVSCRYLTVRRYGQVVHGVAEERSREPEG